MSELEEVLATFVAESRELLEQMEAGLLGLEGGADAETLNAVFRAAHTIKGSAGLFGLDFVVGFAHRVEHVLDRLREGAVAPEPALVALLLACRDHIGALIERVDAGTEPEPELAAAGEALAQRLGGYLEAPPPAEAAPPHGGAGAGLEGEVETDSWHVSVRFPPDLLRMGMDPLAFVHYLQRLGRVQRLVTVCDHLPSADDFDPERCYLGLEVELRSECDKAAIAETFEFIEDEARISILPPHSRIDDYRRLIAALPEEDRRVGAILRECGALTERELALALAAQAAGEGQAALIGEHLVERRSVHPEVVQAALEKQQGARERRGRDGQYLRVRADKLDGLINLVGELVVAGAAAQLHVQRIGDGEAAEASAAVSAIVEQIRDQSLGLRMVPIGETFNRFHRVVHDVAGDLDKRIRLQLEGADTELDKSVVEKITDPLTHLIRNAIDHGIEAPAARRERGKPEDGRVRLNAYHDSGSIVIEVADDGAGIDAERLRAKAEAKGLVRPDQELERRELLGLIFEPGLSTAEQVSDLSGRGVGMDVVRRNIEALRGSVEVESLPAEGTTIRIRLPLTLAIIEGFLMRVAESDYVLPLELVSECIELDQRRRAQLRGRRFIELRGEVLPLLRLREFFRCDAAAGRRENVVVVQFAGRKAGLVVDELLGELQTVIKPLGRILEKAPGIGGATILGSGRVALILDVPALLLQVARREESDYGARAPAIA